MLCHEKVVERLACGQGKGGKSVVLNKILIDFSRDVRKVWRETVLYHGGRILILGEKVFFILHRCFQSFKT